MRLDTEFYTRDVVDIAKDLLSCKIILKSANGNISEYQITETEAYLGTHDKASHVSKGRTARTETMYMQGGVLYMYLVYGMHWMMNVVCGPKDSPQAVLIRGIEGIVGPGRLTKAMSLDKSYNAESLISSKRIWISKGESVKNIISAPRVGIDYAGEYWKNRKLRFIAK